MSWIPEYPRGLVPRGRAATVIAGGLIITAGSVAFAVVVAAIVIGGAGFGGGPPTTAEQVLMADGYALQQVYGRDMLSDNDGPSLYPYLAAGRAVGALGLTGAGDAEVVFRLRPGAAASIGAILPQFTREVSPHATARVDGPWLIVDTPAEDAR